MISIDEIREKLKALKENKKRVKKPAILDEKTMGFIYRYKSKLYYKGAIIKVKSIGL